MNSVEVIVRFDSQGKMYPLRFDWNEKTYQVDSVGRRWIEGMAEHILVRVTTGKVYELVHVRPENVWYLKLIPDPSVKV